MRVRILESTERKQPVLAAPGTDQNSESLFYIEVRPLRRAWIKGFFSSHLQLATSLHVQMDQQYYLFFFLLFIAISYFLFRSHTPLYAVLSKLLLWSLCARRFSCLKTSWTLFSLKSLIQIIIWLFFPAMSRCRLLVPQPTLPAVKGQSLHRWNYRVSLITDIFNQGCAPANNSHPPAITLLSLLRHLQHPQVFLLDSYQHVSAGNAS